MNDEDVRKAQEYWQGFPEAPYSDSIKWVDGAGFEHLSTCRAWSGPDLYNNVARMIANIQETGGEPIRTVRPSGPVAPPPEIPKAVQQAMAEGDNAGAAELQAALDDVGEPPTGKKWLTMNVSRMVIKPEPGDLYTLEVYQSGHKWPDLRVNKRKIESVRGLVKHITSADPTKPQDLTINATAYYCEGKAKDNGQGFWLDLYALRPAA